MQKRILIRSDWWFIKLLNIQNFLWENIWKSDLALSQIIIQIPGKKYIAFSWEMKRSWRSSFYFRKTIETEIDVAILWETGVLNKGEVENFLGTENGGVDFIDYFVKVWSIFRE